MSLTKTVGFLAVTTLAAGGAAFGQSDMQAQIAELKAQIAELKGAQGSEWLTEQRAAEIRGIVTDVLADAETRSSLQGAGSGYNGGFMLASSDGNFSMKINLLEQIRWSFNDNDADQAYGFENKRTRLTFSGNMVDSSWSYKLAYYLGYSNSAENFDSGDLADANVTKDFKNGFTVTVGQMKLPFSAEYSLDAGNLQFSDYSVVNTIFSQGYGQGLGFGYAADQFRVAAAYVNSTNQVNADWDSTSPTSDWAITARGEFKFQGDWAQFNDAQSWKGEGMGIMAGLGYAASRDDASDATPTALTLDVTVDFGGANIAGAYYWADDDVSGNNPTGFTISGGVFLADDFELVARWESFDNDAGTELSTFTVGGNWYFAKNTAKFGVELGWAADPIPFDVLYANWVTSADDGEWVIRGQMSFSF